MITGFNGFFPQMGFDVRIDSSAGPIGNITRKAAICRAMLSERNQPG